MNVFAGDDVFFFLLNFFIVLRIYTHFWAEGAKYEFSDKISIRFGIHSSCHFTGIIY